MCRVVRLTTGRIAIMSHGSTQVASGNTAHKIGESPRDTKEVIVLAGVVLFLGGLLAAAWLYSQTGEQVKAPTEYANVPDLLKKSTDMSLTSATMNHPTQVAAPVVSTPDIIHADIYFEVGRKGLTDEGKAQLSAQAAMLKQHEDYGVLIQGHTDQQGAARYNKQLGLK
jgi:peptidoglycan-associated lipoprotein